MLTKRGDIKSFFFERVLVVFVAKFIVVIIATRNLNVIESMKRSTKILIRMRTK